MGYKFLILLLVSLGIGYGQQSNTVYQIITENNGTDPYTSPAVRNIGQAGHDFLIVFTNAPAMVCANPLSADIIEGSYDNITWVQFGTGFGFGIGPNAKLVHKLAGQGSYPYVRLRSDYDGVNCNISVYYSGTITQAPVTYVGGSGTSTLVTPIPTCERQLGAIEFLPGVATVITTSVKPGEAVIVCAMLLNGQTAIAQVAPTTLTIYQSAAANCATNEGNLTGPIQFPLGPLSATNTGGSNLTMGSGLGMILRTTVANYTLCGLSAGANVWGTFILTTY